MNIKICTPVIGKTLDEFLENLQKTEGISDCIEVRVDSIQNISVDEISVIKNKVTKECIFTCRKKSEGGDFYESEDLRIKILKKAFELEFDYVDVELSTIQEHLFSKKENTKLIVSYHNFEETPSYWDMQRIIHEMNSFQPDILKIAPMLNEEYEQTKMYRLLTNKPHNEERIVIGMGEKGKMTRVLGPLLGSYLTFASTEFGESAPGQISINELKEIYKHMSF